VSVNVFNDNSATSSEARIARVVHPLSCATFWSDLLFSHRNFNPFYLIFFSLGKFIRSQDIQSFGYFLLFPSKNHLFIFWFLKEKKSSSLISGIVCNFLVHLVPLVLLISSTTLASNWLAQFFLPLCCLLREQHLRKFLIERKK